VSHDDGLVGDEGSEGLGLGGLGFEGLAEPVFSGGELGINAVHSLKVRCCLHGTRDDGQQKHSRNGADGWDFDWFKRSGKRHWPSTGVRL
jgi:hypothetical protein